MNKSKKNAPGPSMTEWLAHVKGQMQMAISAMLERSVTLRIESPRRLRSGDYDKLLPDGPVAVSLAFGPDCGWHIIMPRSLAGSIADLASMGDGSAEFNQDVHPGTLSEIWGQVASDIAPEVTGILGDSANLGQSGPNASPDELIAIWGGEPAIISNISIENFGDGKFIILMESGFSAHFSDDAPESSVEEPAPGPVQPRQTSEPEPKPAPARQGPVARPAAFEDFGPQGDRATDSNGRNINSLLDISLPITIELGRTKMLIREVLDLGPGSVIELDKVSGEPVDLFVNDKKFARGEVVVIEENFGVRITELIKVEERIKALR